MEFLLVFFKIFIYFIIIIIFWWVGGWLGGGGGGGIKYESYWLVCMQGNGCSRTIFIDSKVLLGWSNGQRQINNWAGLMILLISIYKGRSLRSQMSKILIHWIYGYHRDKIKNGYWTSSRVIWSEIIRVIFDLKSQLWFQTKIARHEVQLPLYYSHFEIAEFSQYQYLFDLVAGLLKAGREGFYISFCTRKRNDAI